MLQLHIWLHSTLDSWEHNNHLLSVSYTNDMHQAYSNNTGKVKCVLVCMYTVAVLLKTI